MTNLQAGRRPVSPLWLRRLWFYAPIGLGALVTLLLLFTVLVPQWLAVQKDLKRRSELQLLRDEVLVGKGQIQAMAASEERAKASQDKLFEIVTGNGDLSTFMAMVDREASLAGVQLDQFEPQLATGEVPGAPGATTTSPRGTGPAQAPPPGAAAGTAVQQQGLERKIKGLTTTSILLSARGTYPALLDFLRRLELLNVLVVQSDLRLLYEEKPAGPSPQDQASKAAKPVQMKVLISLYGRDSAALPRGAPTAATPAATAGGAASGGPAAPPGAAPAAPPPAPAR
jgi:type IV pilus assembly protein PilO